MAYYDIDKKLNTFVNIFMLITLFACLYPFWYVFCISLTNDSIVSSREIWFWPKAISIISYRVVFSNSALIGSFIVSVKRTVTGSLLSVFLNAFIAYGLSKKHIPGRKLMMYIIFVTMYFSGGLVPWFLLLKNLSLTNNFWGLVIPSIYSGWTIIIIKTFFSGIPESMEESARIDGANDIVIFFRIIISLSTPILATMGLFSAVHHWNDWFVGDLIFLGNKGLPLQTVLMKIIFRTEANLLNSQVSTGSMGIPPSPEPVKMAAIITSTVPIICVYPFLQKYFVKGIMVGSIKG